MEEDEPMATVYEDKANSSCGGAVVGGVKRYK
jgi:hypothetical protein